jgi:serine/threonine protein kinase
MEYVDGPPITQYCDSRRLNTRERLELFVAVCLALQHAHQKGVIHRDIKPSNVLVSEVDGRPVPKVIDFGIAKATDQRAAENLAFTQLGQFVGTPEYMSPEQADLTSGNVDTSSDVYSLGVLLYELLIGAVPFDVQTLRKAGLAELLRIIREEEPESMPAKLTGMGDAATDVAARRRTDPGTLKRLVSGDLNWIAQKAMDKDQQRRYSAASELAADIRRHLEDQPVLASPPSAAYRTRKFVRRHRLAIGAAACVFVALIAGVVVSTAEAVRAQRAETLAVQERDRARQMQLAESR